MPTQRGRKSASQLTILTIPDAPRLPPKGLTKPQIAIWRNVTATLPPEYFAADTEPLLVAYCRHVASMDQLQAKIDVIEAAGGDDTETYASLLTLRAKESATLIRLAQVQRLTQQSRYRADAVVLRGTSAKNADKPWQAATSP